MYWSKKCNICLQNVMELQFKAAEKGNAHVKYKYLKVVLKYSI